MVIFALGFAGAQASSDPHFLKAKDLRAQAQTSYDKGDYDGAAILADRARAELKLIARAGPELPATYTVRLIPADRDCLYKIAGYSFVYSDSDKWTVLYKANKAKLSQPNNPDLILPDIVLDIPSIAGEKRSGAYDSNQSYPAFGPAK